jgi:hypothetical protein
MIVKAFYIREELSDLSSRSLEPEPDSNNIEVRMIPFLKSEITLNINSEDCMSIFDFLN